MKLFISKTSPYARRCALVVHERDGLDQVSFESADPWAETDSYTAIAPSSKVPALVLDDGSGMIESALIAEYLDANLPGMPLLSGAGAERWRILHRAALAQATIDSALAATVEKMRRPEEKRWAEWQAMQERAILRLVATLEAAWGGVDEGFGFDGIAVATALDYLDLRHDHLGWRDGAPRLSDWFAQVAGRPSMQATDPR